MDCVLDSGCVFDPVAHVYLFLHLHLAALLPEVELCPSLLCHPLPCQCHIHLWSALQSKGAPHVWDTRATGCTSEGLYMGGITICLPERRYMYVRQPLVKLPHIRYVSTLPYHTPECKAVLAGLGQQWLTPE